MLTHFVEVAVGSPEVEPTVPVLAGLEIGDRLHTGLDQFIPGKRGVVDPEPGHRSSIEMIVLHRVGSEQLETITVGRRQSGETGDIGHDRHAKHVGKEPCGSFPIIGDRSNPNDPFDLQTTSFVNRES